MSTKQKLIEALTAAGAPEKMIAYARVGGYDDYQSESATPICDLVLDAQKCGLDAIAKRAANGEFDGTKEEADEWLRGQGKHLLRR